MLVEFYSMADLSMTTERIPTLFAGGCWARRQLRNGIKYVPVASKPMKSLSFVEILCWRNFTRRQIAPRPLDRFQSRLREVVGPDASYAMV